MALVNPNIAMSYRGVQIPQQNALADYAAIQQIQAGQRQAEVSQMQLESLRREQAALAKMQAAITAKGGPSDLNVAAEEMINSGIPEYFKQGLVIKQTLDKQSRFAKLLNPIGGAAPAAAPASEPYEGYNEAIGMTPSVNAMAPAAAPVNAMADLQRKINEAYMIATPEALAFAKAGEERLKPMTVSPGASVFQGGAFIQAPAAPAAPTDIAKLIKERDALPKGDPNRALYDREIADRGAVAENARQRLAFDKNKFNWEKANPGMELKEDENGDLYGINKRTLQVVPVNMGGAAPAAAPLAVGAAQAPLAGATPTAAKPFRGKGQGMTEGERKASTLLQRLRFSEGQLTKALVDDPDAAKPGIFTSALDMLSTPLANTLTPEARQRVQSAQLDILDAALTLGTGAAYTKEQLEGYRSSYFPAIGDGPTQVKDKKARLQNVISAANIAAGKGAKLVPSANENDPLGLLGGK
jgi:hypothetical protein